MNAWPARPRLLAIVLTSFIAWPVSANDIVITSCNCMPETDEEIARANARVDAAERNLAVARQRLPSEHVTPADRARVQYYMQGVQIAHRQLTDLLRARLSRQ
jgi:hypothetical protein